MTNSESASQPEDIPTDESSKRHVDTAPKNAPTQEELVGLPEVAPEVAPEVDASPSPSAPDAELTDSFINDGPRDASAADEESVVKELTREETGAETDKVGVQTVDIAKADPRGAIQKNPLSPSKIANELQGGDTKKKEPVASKQAVQDPGLVDLADLPPEGNIIDVDTFDDDDEDVSEDDAHSPTAEEFVSEAEDPDDPKNVDTAEVMAPYSQSEAIDLTESPSTKPTESAKEIDSRDLNISETPGGAQLEPITDMPVDVDESRVSTDGTKMKRSDQGSETHDDAFSITKSDGDFDGSTPDTDTVSADVNIDVNGDDTSSQQAHAEDDSTSHRTKAGIDINYLADDTRYIEPDRDKPTAAAQGDGISADENKLNGSKGTLQGEPLRGDILDVDGQDTMNRNTEPEMVKAELETSIVDGGNSNMPILDNKVIEEGSASIALDEKVSPKEEEPLPGNHDELQVEDKNITSVPKAGHFARYQKNGESVLGSNMTGDSMTVPSGENLSSFNQVANEDNTPSEPFARLPKLQHVNAKAEGVTSVISNSVSKGPQLSAESQLEGFSVVESTAPAKPTGLDAGISVADAKLHGSVSNEPPRSTEKQHASGSESQEVDEGKQQEHGDNSKMEVDIVLTSHEDESEQKVAAGRKAFSNAKEGSDTLMSIPESKDEGNRTKERESTLPDQNLKVSDVKGNAVGSDTDHLPEQSKGTGTRHQAPLFGIQLSMPIKTGPVSFSSPPKFPRYSMNPQAVPFFPSKRGNSDGSPEKSKAIVAPVATPTEVDQEISSRIEAKQESSSTSEEKASEGTAHSGDKNARTGDLLSKEVSTPADQADVRPRAMLSTPAIAPTDKAAQGGIPAERGVDRGHTPESEQFLRKPATKKVSFAPTPVKDAETLQKLVEEQGMQRTTIGKTPEVAKQGNSTSKPGRHSALADPNSESNDVARFGKTSTDTDTVKEKQRIIQVQTDEGLRREVANVTVAIRQDNSKMKLDRKKLTIQLTTGTEESGKLQFLKGSGSSLKLYASLESKKDYLRVRKVTNRQYCMSVAKMAPPGDDAADIVEKYFVHFDERDIFEEMYSQCVANLQKQPKNIPKFGGPDKSKKAAQTPGEESTEEVNRLSTTKGGVKRSAENDNATQASKKSKLLADKKKLLDKMAALRRKKEQKGGDAGKGGQTQPIASHSGRSSLPSADSGPRKSAQQTDRKVQSKSENTERNTSDPVLSVAKIPNPSKRRASEKAGKDNVSKRARVTSSVSAIHESKILGAPKSGVEPSGGQSASANAYNTAKDEILGGSTESKPNPTTQSNSSKGQQTIGLKQTKTSTDTKLPHVESDRPQHPDAGALMKVTEDFKKTQKERDSLQRELAARDHSLLIEKAKTSQVQRENSQAWQRIMSLVEALGDGMGRLRRDETDRSMGSLKRCEPSSSEDFFDRLHSFRPSTWAAFENSEIGALECAVKGWHNSGPNTLRSSEGSEIVLSPSYDDLNLRQSEVERIRSLLREGHSLLSGWIGQACPEAFRTFAGSHRTLTKENLRANTETLRCQGFDAGDLRFDWGANALLLSDDVCEKLAVYNWSVDGECLRCSWCNRRVGVQGESRFNATSTHYAFCPFRSESWKDSVLYNARTLGIEGGGDVLMRD